jgi:hypothetical protein
MRRRSKSACSRGTEDPTAARNREEIPLISCLGARRREGDSKVSERTGATWVSERV